MKIRMKKAAAGPNINWPIGSTQDVDDETGQALLDDGAAERLDKPVVVEPTPVVVEPTPVTVHVDSELVPTSAADGADVAPTRKGKKA